MGCECNKTSKIVFVVAIILSLVGVIIFIAAIATASASFDVGFEIEKKSSGALTIQSGSQQGGLWYFEVYISQSDWETQSNCDTIHAGVTITGCTTKDNTPIIFLNECSDTSSTVDGTWQKTNEPPLRKLGKFPGAFQGLSAGETCTIKQTSGKELWVVDTAEEVGEAVGGIMAAIGMVMVGIVVGLIGLILLCVGCCCLGNSSGGGKGSQPTTVVIGQRTE